MARERTTRDQLEWVFDLVRRATRYWMLTGAVFVLGAALSLTLALGKKPQYESEVVLLYQEMISQSVLQGRDVVQSSRSLSSRYKEMVFARKQLAKIVDKFAMLKGVVEDEGMVAATEILRQRISFRDNGTGTFRIVYRGDSRDEAKDVAETIAALLIAEDNDVRQKQAEATKNFLVAEKSEAETTLKASERLLAEFLAEHPEFAEETASVTAGAAIRVRANDKSGSAPAPRGDAELAALLRQRARTKALIDNPNPVAPTGRGAKTAERIAAEKVLEAAQRELDVARAKLADAQARFTELHPDVRAAQAAAAAAERDVVAKRAALPSLDAPPEPVEIDRDALEKQLVELDRQIAERRRLGPATPRVTPKDESVAMDLVEIETLWTKLMRTVAEERERVERLESRVFTADITASSEFSDASQLTVIDDAFKPPAPAGRSRRVVALAGAFVFALLGFGLALGLALVDDRIFRRFELEVAAGVPVMTVVPDAAPTLWERLKRRAEAAEESGKERNDG